MKKIVFILTLTLSSLLFASCAASRFYSGPASTIRPIALVQPYSYITDAVGNWSTEYLDDISKLNQDLISSAVNSAGLPIGNTVPMTYDKLEPSMFNDWMRDLAYVGPGRAKYLAVPGELRDAVEGSGCRYGLVITDLGYLKNPDELAFEYAVDVVGKVLDAVLNNEINVGSDAEAYLNGVFALIFDNQTGEVVWYGAQPRRYKKNPVDPRTISAQINALFKDFR